MSADLDILQARSALLSQVRRIEKEPAFNDMIFEGDLDHYDEYGFKLSPQVAERYNNQRVVRAVTAEKSRQIFKRVLDVPREAPGVFANILMYPFKDIDVMTAFQLGVPHKKRREVWLVGSGVSVLLRSKKNHFKKVCQKLEIATRKGGIEKKKEDAEIDKDMGGRTTGKMDLDDYKTFVAKVKRVVQLHCLDKKEDGYAQGLNMIASAFIVQNMTEEEAFWMMHHVTQVLFPGSFSRDVYGQHADCKTLEYYFSAKFARFRRFLDQFNLDIAALFSFKAFGSLLCDSMPYESVFTVWDYIFTGGGAYQFHICLLKIIQYVEKKIMTDVVCNSDGSFTGMDSSDVLLGFQSSVAGIVDMPRLLASELDGRPIDRTAFEWRRNKTNEFFHNKFVAPDDDGSADDKAVAMRVQSIRIDDTPSHFVADLPPSEKPPTPRGMTRTKSRHSRLRANTGSLIIRANSTPRMLMTMSGAPKEDAQSIATCSSDSSS